MFTPQRYMTLVTTKDRTTIRKNLFGMIEEEFSTLNYAMDMVNLYKFFDKYKKDFGILIENNKDCISVFKELIDEGDAVPGYVILFEDYLFFILNASIVSNGIRRVGGDEPTETLSKDIIKLPDIRKLLDRV